MAQGSKRVTIGQPSKPRILSAAEAEALTRTTPNRPDLVFTPSPAEPLDHERQQIQPTGKTPNMTNIDPANYPATPRSPAPAAPKPAKPAGISAITDKDVARLMPNIPSDLRNNEIVRKRAYYYDQAEELGKTAAKGELTLIALAEKTLDGAIEGALQVLEDNAHALEMYHHFNNARAKARPQTEESIKTKARQLNWFIKLGAHYREPAKKFFNDMVDLHNTCARNPAELKDMKYTAVYEDVTNLVRQQMLKVEESTDNLPVPFMDAEEARANHIFKASPKTKEALDLLIAAFKALESANEGKPANEKKDIKARPGLHSQELIQAMQIVQDFVRSLDNIDPDDKARFMRETAHKKPGKRGRKKAAPATTSLPDITETEEEEVPVGYYRAEDGEVAEIPEGYYLTEDNELAEIPAGYEIDRETGELVNFNQ